MNYLFENVVKNKVVYYYNVLSTEVAWWGVSKYYVTAIGQVYDINGKILEPVLFKDELYIPYAKKASNVRYFYLKDIIGYAFVDQPRIEWVNRRKNLTRYRNYTGPFDHKDGNKLNCAVDNLILKSDNK